MGDMKLEPKALIFPQISLKLLHLCDYFQQTGNAIVDN